MIRVESGAVMWVNTADTFNAASGLVILLVTGERLLGNSMILLLG